MPQVRARMSKSARELRRAGTMPRRRRRIAARSRAAEVVARQRVALHPAIRLVARDAACAPAPAAPAPRRSRRRGASRFARHAPRAAPRGRSTTPVRRASMKSSAIVASGAITRSTDEWLMSRSCQSAMFSSAAHGVAAQQARQAGDVLGEDRVALVRHRRRALLPAPNGSCASPTSVRCRWRISTAMRSHVPAEDRQRARRTARGGRAARPASRPARARARAARHTPASTSGGMLAKVPTAPESLP